ncbi:heme-binding protein [Burkholderiales bacterium]|jgi:glc operon protein GlcG|nr:heme-binding protein [Betaproteobacteria bacterium]MBT7426355.1 heme-binding protein [Betaproteobacteria bacterium]MDC3408432.1 heme-binding protein [Burkholderiales bacterium]
MKKFISLIILSFSAALFTSANAVEMRPVLTLDMAKKMAQACESRATVEGWRMNIAIMDAGGNLIYFQRMDRAFLKSIEIAILKAETSAGFPFSTKVVEEIAATRVPGIAHVPGVAAFEGGLPVMTASGEHIGSIGVSGAPASDDGLCAQAGIDAIAAELADH